MTSRFKFMIILLFFVSHFYFYQRYANVWANKGYDLVFKTCACDCGHGSLRKDLDFVPPKAVEGAGAVAGAGAGAAQPQPEIQDKKKKKKEKTSLKPKLNFSVLNVSGSYFGSIKQKEVALNLILNSWFYFSCPF